MSTLNNYHPFRNNVDNSARAVAPTASSNDTATNSSEKDKDGETKNWFSPSIKVKIIFGTLSAIAIWYVIGTFFEENASLKAGFYSTIENADRKIIAAEHKPSSALSNGIFDEHDLDERGRSVSDTRSKLGFFANLFCRNGKRASFCD